MSGRLCIISIILAVCFLKISSLKNNYDNYEPCDNNTLIFTTVLFRHGDRTPDPNTVYPTDPYKNHSYFPYNLGDLIQKGMQRMYNKGKNLRRRYQKFLGDFYFQDLVYSETDDYKRCQLSLQCVLAGLFPPNSESLPIPGLNWQPIPYQIEPNSKILVPFKEASHKIKEIPPLPKPTDDETKRLYEYVKQHSGYPIMNIALLFQIEDRTRNEVNNGLPMPKWIQPIWPEPLVSNSYRLFYFVVEHFLPTAAGSFISKVVNDTLSIINGTCNMPQRKMILYSGHDVNVAAILGALQLYSGEPIQYGALISFELHKIGDIFGFQVYLDNYDGLKILNIPFCGTFCPLDQFIKHTKWLWETQT